MILQGASQIQLQPQQFSLATNKSENVSRVFSAEPLTLQELKHILTSDHDTENISERHNSYFTCFLYFGRQSRKIRRLHVCDV